MHRLRAVKVLFVLGVMLWLLKLAWLALMPTLYAVEAAYGICIPGLYKPIRTNLRHINACFKLNDKYE
jgi:hypothetical protein